MTSPIAFDVPLGFAPDRPGEISAKAESDGIDGVWSAEAGHDPYLPLAAVAASTTSLKFGTAIAVAFPRSPMAHAQTAWDLHRMAPGRFMLGLGPQVKAHNERRYGVPGDRPAARMRDMVKAIQAIWETFQNDSKLDYQGEYWKLSLMTPFFNPGPVDAPPPPILIAAVGEHMLKVAGGDASGVHVHPLHTQKFLDDFLLPTVRGAAEQAGKNPADVILAVPVMIATGRTQSEVDEAKAAIRAQISFYASTPAYRGVLDTHDRGETFEKLHALSRSGQWDEMPDLIDDELFDEICTSATWDQLAGELAPRYQGRATRLMPYMALGDETPWGQIAKELRDLTG